MLTNYQKELIIEIAQADFECGQFTTKEFFLEDEEGDFPGVEKEAAEFYNDLIDLGPAGMLEDYPDLNWSDEFIAEYGDPDEADEDFDEYDDDEDFDDSERLDEQYPIDVYKKDYEDYRKSLDHGIIGVIDDFLDKIDDKRVAKAVGKIVGEYYDELKGLSEKDRFNRVCDLIEEKYPKLHDYMNMTDLDKFELPKKGRVQVGRSLSDIKFDENKSRRTRRSLRENLNDGWSQEALDTLGLEPTDELGSLLGDLLYELRHGPRGSLTGCKTYMDLAKYIRRIAKILKTKADEIEDIWIK